MINYWEKFEFGAIYHLFNKTIGGRKLFLGDMDYTRFLNKFDRYFGPYINLYAFCLIPNHYHFMFRVKTLEEINQNKLKYEGSKEAVTFLKIRTEIDPFLTDQLRRWFSGTSLYMNKKYNVSGQLFLEKAKRVSVKTEKKVFYLLCYIHHKPIHHGITNKYEDWPHSSYLKYLSLNPDLGYVELLTMLGNEDLLTGRSCFIRMHEEFKEEFTQDR